jgi:hypothetical protein
MHTKKQTALLPPASLYFYLLTTLMGAPLMNASIFFAVVSIMR